MIASIETDTAVAFDADEVEAIIFALQERITSLEQREAQLRRSATVRNRQMQIQQARQIAQRNREILHRLRKLDGNRPVIVTSTVPTTGLTGG